MFRKFLKRSIPFLVAAVALIGATALPVHAAYYVPYEDNTSLDFAPYDSYLKFDIEAYNDDGELLGFSMPSTITHSQDQTRSDIWLYPELGFTDNYRMRLFHEKSSNSYLMTGAGHTAYYKHSVNFDYSEDASYVPGTAFIPTDITYTFDDFVLMLSDVNWGSSYFLCHIPAGWSYTLSYDYYYVTPVTYDIYYTQNIISEKQSMVMSGTATSDMERALIRDFDYGAMVDSGAKGDSFVLFTNAVFSLYAPDGVDASAANHYFYCGYGKPGMTYPLSWFYEYNDLEFGEVVYVDRVVEVPVFDVGITSFLTNGVGGFLDADIFGTFSIGDLLSILVGVFFVVYLLKNIG